MAARTLPGLGLKGFWGLGFDGWQGENDINLLVLSVVAGGQATATVSADPGSPADGAVYLLDGDHPTNAGGIAIRDAGAWVYVQPPQGLRMYDIAELTYMRCTGDDWAEEAGGGSGSGSGFYTIPIMWNAPLEASEVVLRHVFAEPITFDGDYDESLGSVGTTGETTLAITKNGAAAGEIYLGSGGGVSFLTPGNSPITFDRGDVMVVTGPATPTAAENVTITLVGTR